MGKGLQAGAFGITLKEKGRLRRQMFSQKPENKPETATLVIRRSERFPSIEEKRQPMPGMAAVINRLPGLLVSLLLPLRRVIRYRAGKRIAHKSLHIRCLEGSIENTTGDNISRLVAQLLARLTNKDNRDLTTAMGHALGQQLSSITPETEIADHQPDRLPPELIENRIPIADMQDTIIKLSADSIQEVAVVGAAQSQEDLAFCRKLPGRRLLLDIGGKVCPRRTGNNVVENLAEYFQLLLRQGLFRFLALAQLLLTPAPQVNRYPPPYRPALNPANSRNSPGALSLLYG